MLPGDRFKQRWLAVSALMLSGAVVLGTAVAAGDREAAKGSYREANGLMDQGRFAEAAAAYDRALAQDPQYAEAYHNRALANEMIDRLKAIQDWRRFVEVAGSSSDLKWDVARAQARLQVLESMAPLPDLLSPSHYLPAAGDYYWQIADKSEGEEWQKFPVKVFLGSAPEIKWQQGTREAYDIWGAVFPLELVAVSDNADIRLGWDESQLGVGHAGEELDWVQIKRIGDQVSGRKIAIIRMDLSRNWSKDEMRAIVTHEMGHALGIKEHCDNPKDIMYWQMQEKSRQIYVPGPFPLFWKSLVKNPSQRDINTLIRLYNVVGPMQRFP
jgi:tetratricopeptide (TPR) repeat protein